MVSGVRSILEFSYSHMAAEKVKSTTSFQSSTSNGPSLPTLAKREARHFAFDLGFLGGYYEECVRKPNLTPLCGFHTVLDRDGWSVPGGTTYPH